MNNAHDILADAETRHERVEPHLRDAADWFHDHGGTMFERDEAKDKLCEELDIDLETADDVLAELVGDVVDPVIQVKKGEVRHVGVVEFHEFDGAYGYVDFDDIRGERKRVVCQQCVNEAEHDTEVVNATADVGTYADESDADYETLLEGVHKHYEQHDSVPENVETGASLASGTTVGGNAAFHQGNFSGYSNSEARSAVDGANVDISGDADTVGGFEIQKNGSDGNGIINFKI